MGHPENGLTYFAKPLEVEEPFGDFLSYLQSQSSGGMDMPVKYSQARTGKQDKLR